MKSELLPCPFCGTMPTSYRHIRNGWYIACFKGLARPDNDDHYVRVFGKNKEEAIATWDHRFKILKEPEVKAYCKEKECEGH